MTARPVRTEGIVLKSSPFGEADLIVTYLTRDCGLLSVFARSPRKTKSRFGSSLEPLTCARISFIGREQSPLPRLTQSDIGESFQAIRDNYHCFLAVSELLEMNLRLLPERERNDRFFTLLLATLRAVDADKGNRLPPLYCKIRFLALSGYQPRLDSCGRCGSSERREMYRFFPTHGSVLCGKCPAGDGEAVSFSDRTLKVYRGLISWPVEAVSRVRVPAPILDEMRGLVDRHLRAVLSKPLKSSDFTAAVPSLREPGRALRVPV